MKDGLRYSIRTGKSASDRASANKGNVAVYKD